MVVPHSNQWSTLTETFHKRRTTALPSMAGIMFFSFLAQINKIIAYFNYQLTLFLTQNKDKNILNVYFASFMSYNSTLRQLHDSFTIALRCCVKLSFIRFARATTRVFKKLVKSLNEIVLKFSTNFYLFPEIHHSFDALLAIYLSFY